MTDNKTYLKSLQIGLFRIFASKKCSICNSQDEGILGFFNISDKSLMTIPQLTWSKYIVEPKLATEKLKIMCVNCYDKPKTSKKKSDTRFYHTWSQG